MPKMKTHRGAAKRFKVTGTGKIMRRRAYRKHLFENKPSTRTRRLKPMVIVKPGDAAHLRRELGLGPAGKERRSES
ncbi:MAG: large subunit ribosomal protein [Acidimicrobiia bacterium]|nr:large subunit ribosomal protein [Acidimicrobiia bacterium]